MGDERAIWRAAAQEAQLSSREGERIAEAIAVDEGLEDELGYLVRSLSANLAGAFLRELADRLRDIEPEEAGAQILGALERTLSPDQIDRILLDRDV